MMPTPPSLQLTGGSPLDHVLPHPLRSLEADLGPLTPEGVVTLLSDQIVMLAVAGLLLVTFLPLAVRKRRGRGEVGRFVPAGSANVVEMVCEYFRKEVAEPHLGEHTGRFIRYIWSTFFFILTVNLLGLLPLGTVTPALFGVHVGGTATGNIWVTGTLAVLTMGMMVVNGLRIGGAAYLAHFNPVPSDLPLALRLVLVPLMVVVEVFGTLSKIVALAIRLFANMLAGHTLLAVLLSLILTAGSALGTLGGVAVGAVVVAGAVAINMLEIFVAFLQAFIFTYLTSLFIGMSVNVHHDHEEEPLEAEGPAGCAGALETTVA